MTTGKETLDFIVIGAQKSGTTSLFQYLRHHPEIFVPVEKEVPYFSHDPALYKIEWSAYMSSIARNVPRASGVTVADPARKWGTITPHYTVGTVWEAMEGTQSSDYDERTVPSRIHERLPGVRLIAILRDPVERAVAHHRLFVRLGFERRTFDEAAAELLRDDALESTRAHPAQTTGYIVWGEYGRILSGYFDTFPHEQLLVAFTNQLEGAPEELLRRIHQFIGVNADFTPDNLGQRFNVGRAERGFVWRSPSTWLSPSAPMSPQGVRRALARSRVARAAWDNLPEGRRLHLKQPYERLASRTAKWNRSKPANEVRANTPPSAETLQRLREHFAQDGERLSALLGESPPWLLEPDGELSRR
jgi:hypothetical protein